MGWFLIFALFPFFNKDRLRAGDLIAGSWVDEAPKSRLEAVPAQIADRTGRRETVEQFLSDLMKQGRLVTEFDPALWHTMVDVVTVHSREDMRFGPRLAGFQRGSSAQ